MQILSKEITGEVYDVIILGGGVAGLAAAMTVGQLGLRVLVLEKTVFGGSVAVLETVSGYPGIEKIGGWELTQTMAKQASDAGCRLVDSIDAVGLVTADDGTFWIKCSDTNQFQARSVIMTTGGQPRLLGLENEAQFAQNGVHTCAQCAGPRYSGKKIAIVGNGSWALEAALYLLSLGCSVTFVTGDSKINGNVFLVDKLFSHERFHFMGGHHIEKLRGTEYLEEIDAVALKTSEIKRLQVEAVFVYRGIVPNITVVSARHNEKGFLLVDENNMTSLPGVFAAGRVVYADLPIQVLIGDGSRAALSAAGWLQVKA